MTSFKNYPAVLHCLLRLRCDWVAFVMLAGVFIMKTIVINSPKHGIKEVLVDSEDFAYLNLFKWHLHKAKNTFYAKRWTKKIDGNRTHIYMHREIMGITNPKIEIDHKDHYGLNNQRNNLRECSGEDNKKNRKKQEGCISKYLGVVYKESKKKGKKYWAALITHKGKPKYKCFPYTNDGEILAAMERDRMSIEIFGSFASLNFEDKINNK